LDKRIDGYQRIGWTIPSERHILFKRGALLYILWWTRNEEGPAPFAGSQLDESGHVCAIFNTEAEESWRGRGTLTYLAMQS
jgi:hypothetical protein